MKFHRRQLLQLAGAAAAAPLASAVVSRVAWAEIFPARPVRIVVGTPAGGGMDIAARVIAQALSERTGQQFFVENRPSPGSNMGPEVVSRAAPDG